MFRPYDRNTSYLLPPSVDDWLPKDHLARFVWEVVERLDISPIKKSYSNRGERPYDPAVILGLLFYGYATGVVSSRKLEEKTYTCVAFRYIAANQHPDHDTIAHFRKKFLPELKALFLQILMIAQEMGIPKVGTVSLDGTKIKANASKHKALSYGYAQRLEKQLQSEIEQLMEKAKEADSADTVDGMSIPEEITLRQKRLEAIADAKVRIEERAKVRYVQEKAEHDAKIEKRNAKAKDQNKKPSGPLPKPPSPEPLAKDQINLTDEESRIMPSGGGFNQCYNAQASVDTNTMLIVGNHVSNATNDKREIMPALNELKKLPESVAQVDNLLADAGYHSKENLKQCLSQKINPLIVKKRDKHHQSPEDRFKEPPPLPDNATEVEKAEHRLKTQEGKALYAKRKSTVEPVFGIIKNILGFRQFMVRGLENVSGEWNLVSIAWNLKRLHKLLA